MSVGVSNAGVDAADWYAPVRSTFGSATFVSPTSTVNPFSVADGALTISMQQVGGRWQSGHMQTVNSSGQGFALEYGYFEMSAKFPTGAGSWPAFWLLPTDSSKPRVEIDIVEAYGGNDFDGHHAALHVTPVAGSDLAARVDKSEYTNIPGSMFDGQYHTYGAMVTPDWIIIYYDRVELTRFASNDYIGTPLYMCVDLAMNSSEVAAASGKYAMTVDYVRAYADPNISSIQLSGTTAGDNLSGYAHNDTLNGGGGDDTLQGGLGDDILNGGTGNDLLVETQGSNRLRGDDGADSLVGGAGFDDLNGNAGNDTVLGGGGADWVVGGKDDDVLDGGDGSDIVYGNLGNDWCDGGAGDDTVRGGQGNDMVRGGGGADWLSGDLGDDTLVGGAGADTFHASAQMGLDYVVDFNRAEGDRVTIDGGVAYTVAQSGPDVVIEVAGGQKMVLAHVQLSSLTGDWIFYS
ncbi:family 16 glycosylhydrolase [Phenylobacterium sp.]|uniref:family 16 glycosylhydrolase n=1 Tax=Phenylobacterium sp. TaxID=1871053 RepID=UPI002F40FE8A